MSSGKSFAEYTHLGVLGVGEWLDGSFVEAPSKANGLQVFFCENHGLESLWPGEGRSFGCLFPIPSIIT